MKNNALADKINLIFGIIMALIYLTVGVLVYFTDYLHFNQDFLYLKKLFGGAFVLYGFFRFYRVYKKSFEKNSNSEDNEEN